MADDADAVRRRHRLAELAALDVTALLDGEVDDDGAGPHRRHHLPRDQHRRLAPGDERGADDDVGLAQRLGDVLALAAGEILAHLLGIAARRLHRLHRLDVDDQERRAEALDLLLGGEPHVGGGDDAAETPRRGDRLQPGDAGAHHQHARRRDGTGRRHHHRHGAAELGRGIEHGAVSGEVRLRRQHVHRLRAGDARDELHGESGEPGAGIGLDIGALLQRLQHADEHGAALHQRHFVDRALALAQRPLHLEDDVAGAERRGGIAGDLRARRLIGRIRERAARSGAALDHHIEPHADQALGGVRRGGHAPFLRTAFLRDADLHRTDVLIAPGAAGAPRAQRRDTMT